MAQSKQQKQGKQDVSEEKRWRRLIRRFETFHAGRMSVSDFCYRHNLRKAEFLWRRELYRDNDTQSVTVTPATNSVSSSLHSALRRLEESLKVEDGTELSDHAAPETFTITPPTPANPPAGVVRRTGKPAFAEVRVIPESEGNSTSPISVVLSGGREIRIRPNFDEATLVRVVDLLEGKTC